MTRRELFSSKCPPIPARAQATPGLALRGAERARGEILACSPSSAAIRASARASLRETQQSRSRSCARRASRFRRASPSFASIACFSLADASAGSAAKTASEGAGPRASAAPRSARMTTVARDAPSSARTASINAYASAIVVRAGRASSALRAASERRTRRFCAGLAGSLAVSARVPASPRRTERSVSRDASSKRLAAEVLRGARASSEQGSA
jgi:hypothetical protein